MPSTAASFAYRKWAQKVADKAALSSAKRKVERRLKEIDEQPVNYSLCEAADEVIGRSLTDTAELFVANSNGEVTIEKLAR